MYNGCFYSCACNFFYTEFLNIARYCLRHSEVFEETVVVTVQFMHECVEFSTVIPRLQCLVHPDTSLASILSPLSQSHHQQKISHFPPSIVRRHNRWRSAVTTATRQGRQLICIPLSVSRRFIASVPLWRRPLWRMPVWRVRYGACQTGAGPV